MSYYNKHVFLCTNQKTQGKKCCAEGGGEVNFDYLKLKLLELDMYGPGKVRVSKSGCLGRCALGPCVVIYPEGVWYTYSSFADLDEIIAKHLHQGQLIERLLIPSEHNFSNI